MKGRLFSTLIVIVLFAALAGCAPAASPGEPTPVSHGNPTPIPQDDATEAPAGSSPAEAAAVQALAGLLGIPVDQIRVVTVEAVEWPDACLGVSLPGVVCAQVLTPGFSIVVEADGRSYEFHTNLDASQIQAATVALNWHREGGIAGFNDTLVIFRPDEVHGSSARAEGDLSARLSEVLSPEEIARWEKWLDEYGSVQIEMKDPAVADAMSTSLSFEGFGSGQPSEAEKTAMLDWAQNLFNKLEK